jgi:hypothetical protein
VIKKENKIKISCFLKFFKTEMEKDDRRNGPILTKVESTQIFGNIEEIYHLHLTIAEQLDRAFNEDASIGSVFLANVSFYKTIHCEYEKAFEH